MDFNAPFAPITDWNLSSEIITCRRPSASSLHLHSPRKCEVPKSEPAQQFEPCPAVVFGHGFPFSNNIIVRLALSYIGQVSNDFPIRSTNVCFSIHPVHYDLHCWQRSQSALLDNLNAADRISQSGHLNLAPFQGFFWRPIMKLRCLAAPVRPQIEWRSHDGNRASLSNYLGSLSLSLSSRARLLRDTFLFRQSKK